MTSRRAFLAALLASGAAPRLGWATAGSPAYLAAAQDVDGGFALYGLDARGGATFRVPLPARGHAGAGHPQRAEAVAFARRPGSFALVIDCAGGRVLHRLTPPEGRQFNGHGVFSTDGTWLYTCEQQSDDSAGIVATWEVDAGYRRIAETPTGGLGPHDLRQMPDDATLVVANGGIATDPSDRRKLNIETMRPNLTYLDPDRGVLQQLELSPDLHRSSIRHLAVGPDGRIGFAMQWEGEAGAAPPLLGLANRDGALHLAEAPLADELAMQGYAGSIAFSGDGSELAITSPRGGRLHRFSAAGAFLGAHSRGDVCGLAPHAGGFLASDGLGGLIIVGTGGAAPLTRHGCAWDNHIVTL